MRRDADRRLREQLRKIVRMLVNAYDEQPARVRLFGTNTRLDDQAPIEVLGASTSPAEFAAVLRAARQVASSCRKSTREVRRRPARRAPGLHRICPQRALYTYNHRLDDAAAEAIPDAVLGRAA